MNVLLRNENILLEQVLHKRQVTDNLKDVQLQTVDVKAVVVQVGGEVLELMGTDSTVATPPVAVLDTLLIMIKLYMGIPLCKVVLMTFQACKLTGPKQDWDINVTLP